MPSRLLDVGEDRRVRLSEDQLSRLGLPSDSEPTQIGCGNNGCAYASSDEPDRVVKLTTDILDARAAYMLASLPQRSWAVPVYEVWQVRDDVFALVVARATPLNRKLSEAIDWVFEESKDWPVTEGWHGFYEFLYPQKLTRSRQRALDLIDEAVVGLQALGIDWWDFHADNWATYNGHPVVVDFGLSEPLEDLPVPRL